MLRSIVSANRKCANWLERKFPAIFVGPSYADELQRRISASIQNEKPAVILEVGGIDRPLISKSTGYTYVGLDIEERPDCYRVYDQFIVQSIEDPVNVAAGMVISTTLLEHVPNNTAAVRSMFDVLHPGGVTHHYVPSKWHPYSIGLRLVGPTLQKRLIAVLRPDAMAITGYPAFFDHCSVAGMRGLMARQGFVDIEVKPYYRASDYFAFLLPAYVSVALFENFCSAVDWKFFASGFVISARKPGAL